MSFLLAFLCPGAASAQNGLMGHCDFHINKVSLSTEDFQFYSDCSDPPSWIHYQSKSISSHPETRHFWLFLQLGLGGLSEVMHQVGALRQDLEHIMSLVDNEERPDLRARRIEDLLETFQQDVSGKGGYMEVAIVYDPASPTPNPVADFNMAYPEALYFYLVLVYNLEYPQAVDLFWSDFPVTAFLSSLTAIPGPGQVTVQWTTVVERDNLGFHVRRRSSPGLDFVRLNQDLIPAVSGGNSQEPLHYSYIDDDVMPGISYEYQLENINFRGERTIYGTIQATPMVADAIPENYSLCQNYPNPFNASTEIRYRVPGESRVKLTIYDVRGELVKVLVDALQQEGEHHVRWDGHDQAGREVSSGLYFCALETESFQDMMKMVLLR